MLILLTNLYEKRTQKSPFILHHEIIILVVNRLQSHPNHISSLL